MKEHKNSQAPEAALAPPTIRDGSRCRILVVDQSSDLRLLYTDALAGPGCQVDVAESVAAAWKALKANRYHLLVTENDPPELTGNELLRRLRGASMELPVIMAASGWPAHQPVVSPVPRNTAAIRKPFELEVLMETVKNVLRASLPMRKNLRRRNSLPNLEHTTPSGPNCCLENASKEQNFGVR
jgi:DNA-binding NtrC family response regulator